MNKKVKITAIALVVIVLLVILVTCFSNKEDTNNINETTVETTSAKEKIKTNIIKYKKSPYTALFLYP